MRLRCRAAALFVVVLGALTSPDAGAQSRGIDSIVNDFIARQRIPSAAVSVVKDGRVVHAAGYGFADRARRTRATDTTVYEIGSISKQFAALAVMLLVEEGKLRLDDPLSRWLPDAPPAWSMLTIRHVLTHTAGLKDWDGGPDFSYAREWTPRAFIQMVAKYPLEFTPGTRFAYTSAGYPLLGVVIEEATGEPYERFVERRIFAPAGLTHTRFKHSNDRRPADAFGWVDSAGVMRAGEEGRPRLIAPSGGVMSTARDMAKWLIALEADRIVKPATLAQMQQPIVLADGSTFSSGIAWFIDTFHGHPMLLHNGSTVAGFSSVVYRYPADRLAVTVLFTVDRFNAVNNLATRVASTFGTPLWTGAFTEKPDVDSPLGARLVAMLRAIADRRDSELLAANLRVPGQPSRTNPIYGITAAPDQIAFLDREDLGAAGVRRFGNLIRWIYRYRYSVGGRALYYTFELTPEGLVARYAREEG